MGLFTEGHGLWELVNQRAAGLEPPDIIEQLSKMISTVSKMNPISGSQYHRQRTNVVVNLMALSAAIEDLSLSVFE